MYADVVNSDLIKIFYSKDTVWMLVVTMTTLGFGDVVPKAVLARAFVGFASVLGIFLMALFISVVHEALQLKQQEKRILATMENAGKLLTTSRSDEGPIG